MQKYINWFALFIFETVRFGSEHFANNKIYFRGVNPNIFFITHIFISRLIQQALCLNFKHTINLAIKVNYIKT